MKLIKPEVQAYYEQHHNESEDYGASASRNAGPEMVRTLSKRKQTQTALDYGAGKRVMEKYIPENLPRLTVTSYDPCIPGINVKPEGTNQFDVVLSTDVLEHVEPDLIDEVIADTFNLASRTVIHHIACFATGTQMPDGRDLHLIVETPAWWREKIEKIAGSKWFLAEYRDIAIYRTGEHRFSTYLVYDYFAG